MFSISIAHGMDQVPGDEGNSQAVRQTKKFLANFFRDHFSADSMAEMITYAERVGADPDSIKKAQNTLSTLQKIFRGHSSSGIWDFESKNWRVMRRHYQDLYGQSSAFFDYWNKCLKTSGRDHIDIGIGSNEGEISLAVEKAQAFAARSPNSSCYIKRTTFKNPILCVVFQGAMRLTPKSRETDGFKFPMVKSVLQEGFDYFGCYAKHVYLGPEKAFSSYEEMQGASQETWFLQHVEDDRSLGKDNPEPIQRFLHKIVSLCGSGRYKELRLYGYSMGGFASLMYGVSLQRYMGNMPSPPKVFVVADCPQVDLAQFISPIARKIGVHLKDTFPKKLQLYQPLCVAILTGKIGCRDDLLAKAFLKDVLPQVNGQAVHCIRMYSLISRHRTSTQSAKDLWSIFKALEILHDVQVRS